MPTPNFMQRMRDKAVEKNKPLQETVQVFLSGQTPFEYFCQNAPVPPKHKKHPTFAELPPEVQKVWADFAKKSYCTFLGRKTNDGLTLLTALRPEDLYNDIINHNLFLRGENEQAPAFKDLSSETRVLWTKLTRKMNDALIAMTTKATKEVMAERKLH